MLTDINFYFCGMGIYISLVKIDFESTINKASGSYKGVGLGYENNYIIACNINFYMAINKN